MTGGRYKHKSRTLIIRFEDMPGLEVKMRPAPVGDLMDLTLLAEAATAGTATAEQTNRLFTGFAARLVSWNIDGDDDQPVPATLEGVRSLDADLFLQIFEGWFEGMTQAPKASPTPSANGLGELGSLPMATLPPVPVS